MTNDVPLHVTALSTKEKKMSRVSSKRMYLAIAVLIASAVVTGSARGSGPEGDNPPDSNRNASITVTPSDDLAETQVVSVSGTGFAPSREVLVVESSKAWWGKDGTHDRNGMWFSKTAYLTTMSDADGNFGPVMLEVSRTFDAYGAKGDGTYTCAPSDDCAVSAATRNTFARHHLSFAN